jgi:hypothetical protein
VTPTPEEVLAELRQWLKEHLMNDGPWDLIDRADDALAVSQEHCEEYARLWHRDAERVRELEALALAAKPIMEWAGGNVCESWTVLASDSWVLHVFLST